MSIQQTKRQKNDIVSELPDTALVLDVGGGAYPCARADYVMDYQPFAGGLGSRLMEGTAFKIWGEGKVRFTENTWIVRDICDHSPWPFPDKFFDYSICTQTLEDIRDPIWVCSELIRVSKGGIIETPSRLYETSFGMESDYFTGNGHHRWIVELTGECLMFSFKMGYLNLPIITRHNPPLGENRLLRMLWEGSFRYRENLYEMSTEGIFTYYLGRQISRSDLEEWIIPGMRKGPRAMLIKNIRKIGPLYNLLQPIYQSIQQGLVSNTKSR